MLSAWWNDVDAVTSREVTCNRGAIIRLAAPCLQRSSCLKWISSRNKYYGLRPSSFHFCVVAQVLCNCSNAFVGRMRRTVVDHCIWRARNCIHSPLRSRAISLWLGRRPSSIAFWYIKRYHSVSQKIFTVLFFCNNAVHCFLYWNNYWHAYTPVNLEQSDIKIVSLSWMVSS